MSNKVALVTAAGCGSPLGYDVARAFARAGCNIVVTGRNKSRLTQAAKELSRDFGVRALPYQLEVTRDGGEAAVGSLVANVAGEFGRLDVLVNCSQAAKVGELLQGCKPSDFFLAVDSGAYAAFLLMRAAYPLLKESHGTVINCLSAAAHAGQVGFSMVAASKEALRGISCAARAEWEADDISVCDIEPRVHDNALQKWKQEYPEAAAELGLELESPSEFAQRCVRLARL